MLIYAKSKFLYLHESTIIKFSQLLFFSFRLTHAEDQAGAWEREMHASMAAKKALEAELEKVKKQYQQLRDNRALEYNSITQGILNAVKSEFDHMRVDMKIPMSGNLTQNDH